MLLKDKIVKVFRMPNVFFSNEQKCPIKILCFRIYKYFEYLQKFRKFLFFQRKIKYSILNDGGNVFSLQDLKSKNSIFTTKNCDANFQVPLEWTYQNFV